MVTGCKKTISGALTILDTYKGVPVTDIMEFAFANTAITSVVCGDNIRSLGGGAFYNCKNLTSAKLPDHQILIDHSYLDGAHGIVMKNPFSDTPIEQAAYNKGEELFCVGKHLIDVFPERVGDTFKIKNGTISIPRFCREEGYGWKTVMIPGSVKTIPAYAFDGIQFSRVIICQGVERIESRAFDECRRTKEIFIPSTVNYIGDRAIGYTVESDDGKITDINIYGLTGSVAEKYAKNNSIAFADLNFEYAASGPLFLQVNKDDCYVVDYNYGLSSDTVIPSSYKSKPVTHIADEAFFEADNLKSVTIPGSVTRIGKWSFYGCDNLQKVVIANEGKTAIAKEAFIECPKLKAITVPPTVTSIGDCALGMLNKTGAIQGFTIYGATGSVAHNYAKNYGFKFISVEYPPAAPTVKISNTNKGINVKWNAVDTATSYTVYRKVYNTSIKKWGGWASLTTGYTSTAYLDKTAKLGERYIYTVVAANGSGKSGYVATSALKCDMAPTVKATNTTGGVKVKWNKINGAKSYTVYRSAYDSSTGK